MVEISKSGSGEGLGWVTGRGYSTDRREYRSYVGFLRGEGSKTGRNHKIQKRPHHGDVRF